jgi:hypothetical protein
MDYSNVNGGYSFRGQSGARPTPVRGREVGARGYLSICRDGGAMLKL